MTERKPHPDNELIDRMQEEGTPGHQGRSGGNVNRTVGTRAELERADGDAGGVTRATGSDNPADDAVKGDKTRAAIRSNASKGS